MTEQIDPLGAEILNAASQAKKLKVTFDGFVKLVEVVERLGSLQQGIEERQGRLHRLSEEQEAVEQAIAEGKAEVEIATMRAGAIVQEAEADVRATWVAADARDTQIVEDANANAARIIAAATAEADNQKRRGEADLAQAREHLEAVARQIEQQELVAAAKEEMDSIEGKLGEAREAARKIFGGD